MYKQARSNGVHGPIWAELFDGDDVSEEARYLTHTRCHSPKSDLAAISRLTSRQAARWTAGMMGLSVVIKLAIVGG